ncbi:MAG: MFS transporter [Proteobacteria bacterium]|nr:MFS transporter [Pseudomonadota bacterium]MBU6425614.1 MFS transporter [Rhodospirillales bacterium]
MAEPGLNSRHFIPLFITQALGALNDNLFKNALVVLALYKLSAGQAGALSALSGGLFLLPYILVSAPAGQLADAHDKARLILLTKYWELGLMALALAGFLTGDFLFLMAVLLGLGLQAAFFSPLKYSLLPDCFTGDRLVKANGAVEAGTFAGIVLGTVAGGILVLLPHGRLAAPLAAIALSVAGIASARMIPSAPAHAPGLKPDWNLWRANAGLLRSAAVNRQVWFACWSISWFWALGATVLAAFPVLAKTRLHADGHVVTLLLAVFAVGVGTGSLAAARFVHAGRLLHFVLPAGLGMSLFIGDFAVSTAHLSAPDIPSLLAHAAGWRTLTDLALTAICGGLFSVPFYVSLQASAAPAERARMVGANNVLNSAATLLAGGVEAVAYARGLGPGPILLTAAALNLLVMIWIWRAATSSNP